jgi:hypothetical protein
MEGTLEQNEYRKNLKTNFMLPAKRTKISWMSTVEIGRKYEMLTGHLVQHFTGRGGGEGLRIRIISRI